MTPRRGRWGLLALAPLVLPAPGAAQRTQQISGMDADVEGLVTGVSIALVPQLETISGEG